MHIAAVSKYHHTVMHSCATRRIARCIGAHAARVGRDEWRAESLIPARYDRAAHPTESYIVIYFSYITESGTAS